MNGLISNFRPGATRRDASMHSSSHLLPKRQRKAALQSRLQEVLVFELHKDGSRAYREMSVRKLYNYVLEAITTRPEGSNTVVDVPAKMIPRRATATVIGNAPMGLHDLADKMNPIFSSKSESRIDINAETTNNGIEGEHTGGFPEGQAENIPPLPKQKTRKKQKGKNREGNVTYRERLGGYLHPRDMRRLVTPFSASNEPEVMVRRHVILLNCDPLRAIVLRDRLLVLVPDGADSILEKISKRVRGGAAEVENSIFGENFELGSSKHGKSEATMRRTNSAEHLAKHFSNRRGAISKSSIDESTTDAESDEEFVAGDLDDMKCREWITMAFELQCVDAILFTVASMLSEDVVELQDSTYDALDELLGTSKGTSTFGQDTLRGIKNDISLMNGRVQGFNRSLNLVLDEEEDLALMNVSRLITHPERFIQPVPPEVLNEESDEPELILEAYLQQGLSATNQLDLLEGQVRTAEELIDMKLDSVRNRLLYINTLVSLLSLCVSIGSFIGSIFGMNLINHLEDDPDAFKKVVAGTVVGSFGAVLVLLFAFWRAGTMSGITTG